MPILSQQALDELKTLHKKHFGEDLTDDEAKAMGNRLLRLFGVLLRVPVPKEDDKGSNLLGSADKST